MKRLLLPALLHALSCWSVSSGTPVVLQTPDVSVMEGETVNITCCWTVEFEDMTVNWLKNQTNIKSEKFLNHSWKETSDCSDLTFMDITREDSGRYSCKLSVEIPGLVVFEGKGTVITVTARGKGEDADPTIAGGSQQDEVFYFLLRCLPILALVISFLFFLKFGTKAQPNTPAAPGNELRSAQRTDGEDQEEEDGDERESEI